MGDPDRPGVLAPPPLVYVLAIAAGGLLNRVVPAPAVPPWAEAAGGGVIFASFALMTWGGVQFRRAGTSFNAHTADTAVVTTGPYRFSRNPLYVGLTGVTAGLALTMNQAWILAMLIPAVAAMRFGVIGREERYLERKFGR
ncbi:isoprenylcysteine carboxylmethyltransferase family protein, partial [bacterium]|nr:isoprenylcysteine carboxylmethyltransferase family protein [bacterium]